MSGKLIQMECGHIGEIVAHPSFAVCTVKDCNGSSCSRCGKGPMLPFEAPLCPPGSKSCSACGAVRWSVAGDTRETRK